MRYLTLFVLAVQFIMASTIVGQAGQIADYKLALEQINTDMQINHALHERTLAELAVCRGAK